MPKLSVIDFKGLRTDRGQKFVDPSYFYDIQNFNCDDIVGANKILFPDISIDLNTDEDVDGIFEFNYVNSNFIDTSESICVIGGNVYKNFLGIKTLIGTGLSVGKCTFCVLNNKLYIFNGKDYQKVWDGTTFYDMGAAACIDYQVPGNLTGIYYYEVTFVTDGGEERIGSKSNSLTVSGSQIKLNLPIGYSGTASRKIYRTDAGGNTPKLLATIPDNVTLTYIDNIADGSLGASIIDINNELPILYFGKVNSFKIIGCVSDKYPNYVWVSDINNDVFDFASFQDISGIGDDNTPIMGIEEDYSNLIIGTKKNIYVLDVSQTTSFSNVVSRTRANVGVLNGYSMSKIPVEGDIPGGVMFISSLGDIRLFNGNYIQPIATSLDNLRTDNYSQEIKPTLAYLLASSSNIFAKFFNYKYHVIIGQKILIFDIRIKFWSIYYIKTNSYSPYYNVMGEINGNLFIGQESNSIIEKMYSLLTYRDEIVIGYIQSPKLLVGDNFKFIKRIFFFFVTGEDNSFTATITLDNDINNKIIFEIPSNGGAFNYNFFDANYYNTNSEIEDYNSIPISRRCRWLDFKLEGNSALYFRGFEIEYDEISNKETL